MELHELEVPRPSVLPFAIGSFVGIGPLSLAEVPHRHTFYEIVLVTAGRGGHVVDLEGVTLRPPHVGVIAPGQVHHWQEPRGVDGFVVLFNEDFLLQHPGDAAVLRAVGARPWLSPGGEEMARLTALAGQMEDELATAADGYESVLRAYLHILVVRIARTAGWPAFAARTAVPPHMTAYRSAVGGSAGGGSGGGQIGRRAAAGETTAGGNGVSDRVGAPETADGPSAPLASGPAHIDNLVDHFLRLIAAPGQGSRPLASYAREIGVSPGHLHELVLRQTGLTPGRLTRGQRVLEAKRLLAGTELTIRQVCDETGFADPAYFCRFFRRETGLSPGEFRRIARGKHHDPVV